MIIEKKPLNCFDEMQYVEHWCKDIFSKYLSIEVIF